MIILRKIMSNLEIYDFEVIFCFPCYFFFTKSLEIKDAILLVCKTSFYGVFLFISPASRILIDICNVQFL